MRDCYSLHLPTLLVPFSFLVLCLCASSTPFEDPRSPRLDCGAEQSAQQRAVHGEGKKADLQKRRRGNRADTLFKDSIRSHEAQVKTVPPKREGKRKEMAHAVLIA